MRPSAPLSIRFVGLADGGDEAVVEGHHVLDAGLVDGIEHRLGFFAGAGQRLFADDVLAGLGRGDARLGVRVVGAAVVEQLDAVVFQHLAPVGVVTLVAVAARGFRRGCFVAPADGDQASESPAADTSCRGFSCRHWCAPCP